MKLVRRVSRDVNCLALSYNRRPTSEGSLDLTLEQDEGLLKVVPVRRWSAARWDMHIDQAEASSRVFASEKGGVGISYQSEMRQVLVVRSCKHETSG